MTRDRRDMLDVAGMVEAPAHDRPRVPRFVKGMALLVILGLGVVIGAAWKLEDATRDEERKDCLQAVGFRDDNRAMWLWLGERFPDEDTVTELLEQLDTLLPRLDCDDGNPVVED